MNMSDEEINTIRPDYIILDEFHRCGAEMWGLEVKSLLTIYSDVPVLGLSATAIRYLDNQRDMSDGSKILGVVDDFEDFVTEYSNIFVAIVNP